MSLVYSVFHHTDGGYAVAQLVEVRCGELVEVRGGELVEVRGGAVG